jgi:intracellular septation protein
MKQLLQSAKFLLFDLASTLLFFALYAATHNIVLAVSAAVALALGQIGWEVAHGRRVDALQWVSLVVVVASAAGTLHTGNPRFVMLQPSVLYLLTGIAMLQRGWMNRYLPPRALEYVPDLGIAFGYVWAGLMLVSAVVNLGLALSLDLKAWGVAISAWGIASKTALFLIQFAVMKSTGRRRHHARMAAA